MGLARSLDFTDIPEDFIDFPEREFFRDLEGGDFSFDRSGGDR